MSLTTKLYHLREVIENAPEFREYIDAKNKALNDKELQILFGEFDRCKEMYERFGATYNNENQKRMQQLKMKIFENKNYQDYKKTEKTLNQLRFDIAKRIFSTIDEQIYIDGGAVEGGSKRCGL